MKSKFVFLFVFAWFFSAALGRAAEDPDFNYKKSSLSSNEFTITTLLSGNHVAGCSAITRKPKPALFLMVLANGDGTIALPAPRFHVPVHPESSVQKLKIGSALYDRPVVIDGNSVVFEMTRAEMAKGKTLTLAVNGVLIDAADFRQMDDLLDKCVSANPASSPDR